MTLVIRRRAAKEMQETADWVERENTKGAGDRWLDKVVSDFLQRAKSDVKHAICRNEKLALRKYHCFTYNARWVVAYRIEGDNFIIHRFIYAPKLV
jgi:hypothetical protein